MCVFHVFTHTYTGDGGGGEVQSSFWLDVTLHALIHFMLPLIHTEIRTEQNRTHDDDHGNDTAAQLHYASYHRMWNNSYTQHTYVPFLKRKWNIRTFDFCTLRTYTNKHTHTAADEVSEDGACEYRTFALAMCELTNGCDVHIQRDERDLKAWDTVVSHTLVRAVVRSMVGGARFECSV